jgi:glycosyltransferase involved in cell wall biosynthesis
MPEREAKPVDGRQENQHRHVVVVGAGTRFLSAMSYYTIRLTNALAISFAVAAISMRQLIPTFLYPGRARVGAVTTRLSYDASVRVLGSVDWYWIPSLFITLNRLRRWAPDVVIFQWWTGTTLLSYLAIAVLARLRGTAIIVEFHEVLDSAEERIALARIWVRILGRPFFRLASAFVIHSEADRALVQTRYRIGRRPCVVIPHGPLDHHAAKRTHEPSLARAMREAPGDAFNILFFGLIRPYKGLEDLVDAFGRLDHVEVNKFWLTVVGETWEGWDLPVRRIRDSRHRLRITLINRFVDDEEVVAHFLGADGVVLPYHRSSASSPAHVAMSNGLPLVITSVGGLPEAVAGYAGAILVPPSDPQALLEAIRRLPSMRDRRFADPHSWDRTRERYRELIERILVRRADDIVEQESLVAD